MKRSILIGALVGTAVCLGGWIFAQSAKERHLLAAERPSEVKTIARAVPDAFVHAESTQTTDISVYAELQRRIELAKKQADELSQPDLNREVEALRQQFKELVARERALQNELTGWKVAAEAVRTLQMIVEKVPNTKAAEAANAAIHVIQERRIRAGNPQAATMQAHPSNSAQVTGSKPAAK
jgi:hypothetical protein